MFEQVLPQNTKEYLAVLATKKILPAKTYLAGGTAVALHLGHRISFDLDFFTPSHFDVEAIQKKLVPIKEFKLDRVAEETLLGDFPTCKFSLFHYPYPLIEKTVEFQDIKIAGLKDLAASKIGAISSRGTKRDFIDLYYLVRSERIGDLADCLEFYQQKFSNLAVQRTHILKSLEYFEDAEKDEEPKMLVKDYSWPKIKKFLQKEVLKLAKF